MKTIMVVDDDSDVVAMYQTLLEDAGYAVMTAPCFLEATQLLSERHIDLVVTDEDMPEKNGHDLLRAVRLKDQNLPVIIVGGRIYDVRRPELILEGFNWAFQKPLYPLSQLVSAIRQFIGEPEVLV